MFHKLIFKIWLWWRYKQIKRDYDLMSPTWQRVIDTTGLDPESWLEKQKELALEESGKFTEFEKAQMEHDQKHPRKEFDQPIAFGSPILGDEDVK